MRLTLLHPDDIPDNLLIPHYLVHCYLYYENGTALLTDSEFDTITKRLKEKWNSVEHPHKDLIDYEGLSSSGYYIKYPEIVKRSALALFEDSKVIPKKQANLLEIFG